LIMYGIATSANIACNGIPGRDFFADWLSTITAKLHGIT
jgi:hypothetical protein